ncbi:MAG: bifunctional proline dehydrogenase/L-glutamate gamma-semialdehyde dehydrogenase PutA [Acetobacteraceae bacterium]|nr:bifunctional proline dehydrogenase/L-glutamate gamma-semialdehyde dehydrogenase PutA [Acetobacteraceae bacterium]
MDHPAPLLSELAPFRQAIARHRLADEHALAARLADEAGAIPAAAAAAEAATLVAFLRSQGKPGLMERFLAEYGLSTEEGVALMCLAEALLRVPDAATADALIRDKVSGADWSRHLGQSSSPLVNASTWALMLTGRVIGPPDGVEMDVAGAARRLLRRAGEPVIRTASGQAMKVLGGQFVLGTDIADAMTNARASEAKGITFSYDMLGEAARTDADAERYFRAYADAIAAIAGAAGAGGVRANPGISVKLSALDPRYETGQHDRAMRVLVPRVVALAGAARKANMGFNIDAEEADRLDISLDIIEASLRDGSLAGWDGFGVVVQAYGRRAGPVLDYLHALAGTLDRRLMVRLVKGAYWDAEIKRAQVLGEPGFPVFTRKAHTDVSYLACARKLLGMTDRIYPQFATHNAHTIAAILALHPDPQAFEFQRLHGMGEALHDEVIRRHATRLRIYAPVGVHKDLLAYLVRRLLENGANSSFVHQVLDAAVPIPRVVADPVAAARAAAFSPHPRIAPPPALYGPSRVNSRGWNLDDPESAAALDAAMAPWRSARWHTGAGPEGAPVHNPANPDDLVGVVRPATPAQARAALGAAAASSWGHTPIAERAAALRRAADLYEANAPELMALAVREAGKTRTDAVAELREAVDFLRYYAAEAETTLHDRAPLGPALCISPWNFPLAIFTGQVAAGLAAGNPVLAKPAEQTALIAARAVALLHEAGIPADALQLLPGDGPTLGGALLADARVKLIVFTGSTETARAIEKLAARHLAPDVPLIAETGGINAMIVDSSALPEQVVRDAVASAFQSAGQRCSALRLLCLQQDVAGPVLEMLEGAMRCLVLGDPWERSTDVGPLIDEEARTRIAGHLRRHPPAAQLDAPARGTFLGPAIVRLGSIEALREEIFGPVLHVTSFAAQEIETVVERINALGYGLTMGLHTRLEDRVRRVVERARVGNLYVNRNQIGAVVGVQPFGGEALSGTGPKAGGPLYLRRFSRPLAPDPIGELGQIRARAGDLPGPAGESNRLSLHPRGRALCLGEGEALAASIEAAREAGNDVLLANQGEDPLALATRADVALVLAPAGLPALAELRQALAARPGPLVPLLVGAPEAAMLVHERSLSVDTTASGGNVALLAAGG